MFIILISEKQHNILTKAVNFPYYYFISSKLYSVGGDFCCIIVLALSDVYSIITKQMECTRYITH